MPGSFRSAASAVFATGGNSVVVTKPSGVADGDLLVAVGYCDPAYTMSPPAGWTEIESVSGSSRNGKAWKKTAASEGASYTFTLSAGSHNNGIAVGIVAYQDVGTTLDDSSITEASSGTSASAPAVTTVGPNRFVLFFGLIQSSGSSLDPGAGWTSRLNVSEAGGPANTQDGLTVYEKLFASAGSTGSVSATAASAYGGHVAGLVAFPDTAVQTEWYVGMIRGVA